MGRHMEGMGSRGSHIAELPCREKPAIRERWEIIAVDQIVQGARMLWLGGKLFFQNRRRLQLPGIVLVRGEDHHRFIQRQRIEDRGLGIVRIAQVQLFHRFFVG
jgi:hypothetical protein